MRGDGTSSHSSTSEDPHTGSFSMTMMLTILVLTLASSALGHDGGFGVCEKIPNMEGLDMEKFSGAWKVLHKVKTSSECVWDFFSPLPEPGKMNFTEVHQVLGGRMKFKPEAELDTNTMQIKYFRFFVPKANFRVIDTDYDNYALIYKCQQIFAFKRWSASIMVRPNATIDDNKIDELKTILDEYGLESSLLSTIRHNNCKDDDDVLLSLGMGPGLSVKPDGSIIKSISEGIDAFSSQMKMPEEPEDDVDDTFF